MTPASPRTETDAVIETAILSVDPCPVEAGKLYVVPADGGGRTVIDLTGDRYRDTPRRKSGSTTVRDVESFGLYWDKHAILDVSEVYADADDDKVVAVLDAHGRGVAGWHGHRLVYQLARTLNWNTWYARSCTLMGQVEFAELLEANLPDVVEPDGAELLELAQTFSAQTSVSFKSGALLANGARELIYSEDVEASGGRGGKKIVIPKQIVLGLCPYEGSEIRTVTARFRYRINNGDLRLGYVLDRPDEHLADAFNEVVEVVEARIAQAIMRGRPA